MLFVCYVTKICYNLLRFVDVVNRYAIINIVAIQYVAGNGIRTINSLYFLCSS